VGGNPVVFFVVICLGGKGFVGFSWGNSQRGKHKKKHPPWGAEKGQRGIGEGVKFWSRKFRFHLEVHKRGQRDHPKAGLAKKPKKK